MCGPEIQLRVVPLPPINCSVTALSLGAVTSLVPTLLCLPGVRFLARFTFRFLRPALSVVIPCGKDRRSAGRPLRRCVYVSQSARAFLPTSLVVGLDAVAFVLVGALVRRTCPRPHRPVLPVCSFGSFGKRPDYVLSAPQFLCPGLLAVVLRLSSCSVFVSSASLVSFHYA